MFNLKNYLALATVVTFSLSGAYRPKKEIITAIPLEEQAQLSPFFDCRPEGTRFSYLYSPGFQTTEVAMGRLCPQFTAVNCNGGNGVQGRPRSPGRAASSALSGRRHAARRGLRRGLARRFGSRARTRGEPR